MSLRDLVISPFSQSSVSLASNHRYDDCVSSHGDPSWRKDSDAMRESPPSWRTCLRQSCSASLDTTASEGIV
ncbi:unnamed protein product [Brassica rapa subsp. trilocularis]